MADLGRGFWPRETGTGQQVAQLHDRYMMMMMMMMTTGYVFSILLLIGFSKKGNTIQHKFLLNYRCFDPKSPRYFDRAKAA
jgi:hypothetical protein